MIMNIGRNISYTVVVIGLLCQIARAQAPAETAKGIEEIDPKTTTRVAVGNGSGNVGSSIVVPIYFTPAPGVSVGHLKLEIEFISVNMKFGKLERGVAAEMGNAELKTNLREEKNDKGVESSTLTIEATSPAASKSGLTGGLLAYMTMQLNENGRPAKIALRTSAEAEETGTGKPVDNLKSFDGQVEVFAAGTAPAVSCFFFSH